MAWKCVLRARRPRVVWKYYPAVRELIETICLLVATIVVWPWVHECCCDHDHAVQAGPPIMQTPSVTQLRQAVKIADQIEKLNAQLAVILGSGLAQAAKAAAPKTQARRKKRSKLSAAGRAAIVKGQKARWAKIKAAKKR